MAIKVKLRSKPISGNKESLYLDFYPAIPHRKTGAPTRREFLGFFIFNELFKGKDGKQKKVTLNPVDKQHNKNTLLLAEQIRQKRDSQINKPEIYTGYEKEQLKLREKGEFSFVEYFKKLADKRKSSNQGNWISAYYYLEQFTKGCLKFSEINQSFCSDFAEYLHTTKSNKSIKVGLSQNTIVSYFNKLKASLKQAYKDGYLPSDINSKVARLKPADTFRNFLTLEELNSLAKTECENPVLKTTALFSALTGLRFSDIQKLIWGELEYIIGNGYFIKFQQQKTKANEIMPISEQAYKLLGTPKDHNEKVFPGLTYSAYENRFLYQWIGAAGITKKITFHCFRHTYATLQLSRGTDIYTVSKMLGHRDLKTTQIYAKIIDSTKREATKKITLDL